MFTTTTDRPRNVDRFRAASILYGDWGTSKAYVIGLAFAIAGYSSFWLILAVSILSILIGINYIIICKHYPNGGGVYASVRHRSEVISLVGAFFLIADFLVTAALSGLSAFSYLGVDNPIVWTAVAIAVIGGLNFFGPRHTGTLAFVIVILTLATLIVLAIFSIPQLSVGWHNLKPLQGGIVTNWKNFVGVIVALSGVEAIANATGVMKLDPGSTNENPSVRKTAGPAIIWVMIEVAVFTALFSLAITSLSNFEIANGTVNAPGNPGVRDYMLKYLGEQLVSNVMGPDLGKTFGLIVSIAFGALLLSAVNTAIGGLVAVQYLMSKDGELPTPFQKLNRFGVPLIPLLIAIIVPILLVVGVRDIAGLADLYAIGFVGAIATNLGSTSTDFSLVLKKRERSLMMFSFLIMAAIEVTLFVDKPHARMYALTLIVIGLILRTLTKELKAKRAIHEEEKKRAGLTATMTKSVQPPLLCSVTKPSPTLDYALKKAKNLNSPLYVLFIREQGVISEKDRLRSWESDPDAVSLFDYVKSQEYANITFYYAVSDSLPSTIVDFAMRLQVKQLIMGMPHHSTFINVFRGNVVQEIKKAIPENIRLVVIY